MESFLPSLLLWDNSRIMRKTIHHSSEKPQSQFGEWISTMSTSEASNSSPTWTTSSLEKLGDLHSKILNRLKSALLEHDFIIQCKKGSNMPADYLSRLLAWTRITRCPTSQPSTHSSWFSMTFCWKMKHFKSCQKVSLLTNGLNTYWNQIVIIYRLWHNAYFKIRIKLSGSDSMILINPNQHYTYQIITGIRLTKRWPYHYYKFRNVQTPCRFIRCHDNSWQ